MSNIFTLTLTPGELHWLIGVWGFARLPLVADPFSGMNIAEKQSRLKDARESLLKHGLVGQAGSKGWQIDSLAAALAYLSVTAETITSIEVFAKNGESTSVNVYQVKDGFICLLKKTETLEFTLYSEITPLIEQISAWLGVSHILLSQTTYHLPPADTKNLFRAAWLGADKAGFLIQSEEWNVSLFLPFLEKTERLVQCVTYQVEFDQLTLKEQCFFAIMGVHCWCSDQAQKAEMLFLPVNSTTVSDKLQDFITLGGKQ